MSGRWGSAFAVLSAGLLAGLACGSGGKQPPATVGAADGGATSQVSFPPPTTLPCHTADPDRGCPAMPADHPAGIDRGPEVSLGPPITSSQAVARLEMVQGDQLVEPVAAFGESRILVRREPRQATVAVEVAPTFELWDPLSGESQPAWLGVPGKQDFVAGTSGNWVLTVRAGFSLPLPDWQLIARNPITAEEILIAQNDPNIINVPGLPLRLPLGFAPTASISGWLVVWPEFITDTAGDPLKRIQLYDLRSGQTQTLVSVNSRQEDVWVPAVANNTVAWAHRTGVDSTQELVVLDLSSGATTTFPVGGEIYSCALSADARYLAWDDSYKAKYALDLQSNTKVQYAGDEGWGTWASGHYVAWAPSSNPGGYGGFYDFETKEVRFLQRLPEAFHTNIAWVLGRWFVWQELHRVLEPVIDISGSYYYFMQLPP